MHYIELIIHKVFLRRIHRVIIVADNEHLRHSDPLDGRYYWQRCRSLLPINTKKAR